MFGSAPALPASTTSIKGHHMQTSLRFAPVLLALIAALAAGTSSAQSAAQSAAQNAAPTGGQSNQSYSAVLASPIRTPDDRKLDERRKPAEFLAFAQVRPGMKVFDMASGGGTR